MYFNFVEKDYQLADKLLVAKEANIDAANFYIAYLSDDTYHITKGDLKPYLDKMDLASSIIKAINKKMEIDEEEENYVRINDNSNIDNLVKLDKSSYEDNPYFKLIKNVSFKKDRWFMNTQFYKPYEMFTYDEIKVNPEYYQETTPMGFFEDKFNYPAIIEDEYIWMSLIPHEINTMKDAIDLAKGNVLVMGLGLGYFAFMVSNKDNVNKVTIIEKDKNVITLFNEYLLPLFRHKEKINIIEDDAFKYLDNNKHNHFDFAFIDIWHNVGDGFPLWVKFKPYEKIYKGTEFTYWIEESMIAMLRRYILTLYEEKIIYQYSDIDYKKAKNDNDRFINKLYFYLKDLEFNSYNVFHDFLSDESLRKLLINMQ